jgi:L,D-peptidoglycan transpeptidase YkuD (ErfK/YbiS/YcfS/YnhG family)
MPTRKSKLTMRYGIGMRAMVPDPIVRQIALIRVARRPGFRTRGWLWAGPTRIPVAIGRSGIVANKREGDGATPRGEFHPVRLWWRADRLPHPPTLLPTRPIRPDDAWIEDPKHRRYNNPVKRGPDEEGDRLWRKDRLYDLIIELDHNTRPRIAGRGSAVFVHVARPGFGPTAGCVALELPRLYWLLSRIGRRTRIAIR